MSIKSLWRRKGGDSADLDRVTPHMVNGGQIAPGAPWGSEPGVREIRQYAYTGPSRAERKDGGRDVLSGSLLSVAGLVIAGALVGAGYVAYESQRLFALAHNGGDHTRAAITAALPDAGWVAMALVALVAALRGRSSVRARVGVLIFFALSLGAQVMYAQHSPEGVLVAVIAPIALAWMLESFVVEVRRWASNRRGLDLDESPVLSSFLRLPWLVARLGLWLARMCIAWRSTWGGLFDWVRDEAPLAPGRTAASLRADRAIKQAGSAEEAAARAREAALAAAEEIKAAAREEADQTRREAAEEIAAARKRAEQEISAARAEAERQIEDARSWSQQTAGEVQQQAAALVEQERAEARALVEQERARAAEQLRQVERERTALAQRVDAVERRWAAERAERDQELRQARTAYDRVMRNSSGKVRLAELYARLGEQGDPRYLDRSYVAELARELYAAAGLASEGTARTYMGEIVEAALAERAEQGVYA
ncbi:DUF2637 domain-containing protein [Actinomadura mexicana]|uniref:DUF2637 domain-containing protein n=1 Tax=Actinomadura mexicana TaxID=134959 RepID=A0A239HG04_9ACTN|nr:DUF2637 domain-containing protein [Actinomadura mexicana]SNS80270.1 Protein of unknown function [Actinomadura mexicana]